MPERGWTLLIYKLPPHPTRFRIQLWRKLQALGAVYLQDGVAALPAREDLDENLRYAATWIEEVDGSAVVLRATGLQIGDGTQLIEKFRRAADARMSEISESLTQLDDTFPEICSVEQLATLEEAQKREKTNYLKARRLNYCGSDIEPVVEEQLARLSLRVAGYARGVK